MNDHTRMAIRKTVVAFTVSFVISFVVSAVGTYRKMG